MAKPATPRTKPAPPKKRKDKRGAPKGQFKNPPFIATDEQRIRVEAMVTAGAQQWFIAEDLGITERTLQRHFAPQLGNGKHRALSKIGGSMVTDALNGDKDSQKFVLARIGGWKDRTAVEQSGPDGGPIVFTNEPPRRDLSHLSEEEKLDLERLTAKLEQRDATPDQ